MVEQLQRDGTFDELRQQVVNALLADNVCEHVFLFLSLIFLCSAQLH